MNGKTTINATLNPCSAEADKHTYGWRCLSVSAWGERVIRLGVLGVYLDLYRSRPMSRMRLFLYARMRNGAALFFPGGSLTWPMPDKAKKPEGGAG